MDKTISVIGLGYIGLPTAALLVSRGYTVKGIEVNENIVNTINNGDTHIVEPDLDSFVRSAVESGKLKAYVDAQLSDIYIICVPTPLYRNSGLPTPNVDYVKSAVDSIANLLKSGDIIILESTSPVGSTEMIRDILEMKEVDTSDIAIAYCPERVLPGKIMTELVDNDRVIGGINAYSSRVVSDFYKTFVNGKILESDAKTAEMCKLTENSFRDVNIAFANELSMICSDNGVDVWKLIKLANHHPRVNILQPSVGVGGHCIAVDPWFLVSANPKSSKLIKKARQVNDSKPDWVVKKIVKRAKALVKNKPKIACLGLTFKPDIDDLRESPAVEVARGLLKADLDVVCVEPNIESHGEFLITTLNSVLKEADVIVILVGHKEFRSELNKTCLTNAKAMDFCGALI
ncbi:UDP-N-acetyl-D-mannosamine dehydrogenase [Paracoccaceae bacterium]|nr:UDP-N-acetyl-D-mannosamine dehydrogenase [Paracoccaceae bacterium]